MKKKLIIPLIFIVLTILLVCFIVFNKRVTIVNIDINPSVEITLTRNEKVKSVIALNDEAKEIISNDLKGKSLDFVLKTITNNVISKGYANENKIEILIYSRGIDNSVVERKLANQFHEKNIDANIILIKNITKDDYKLAEKYNISPSKASYINLVKKENDLISLEDLINKPVKELEDIKNTGNYCDTGYTLEGDFCLKEIRREPALIDNICGNGYYEYEGKCYEEVHFEYGEKLICRDEFTLKGNKCIKEIVTDAIPVKQTCSTGELVKKSDVGMTNLGAGDDGYICVDKSTLKAPTLRCLTINHIMIGDKCYVGPAPTINGGCPNGDSLVNGGCYSKDDGDQWICPDGRIYEKSKNSVPKYCPDAIRYTNPNVLEYKCDSNATLKDNKCISVEEELTEKEKVCPDSYNLVDNDKCINYNKITSKQNGYVCKEENTRLEDNTCIIYEIIEAKHNN